MINKLILSDFPNQVNQILIKKITNTNSNENGKAPSLHFDFVIVSSV